MQFPANSIKLPPERSASKNDFDGMLLDMRNKGRFYVSGGLGEPPQSIWEHQKIVYNRNGWDINSAPVL